MSEKLESRSKETYSCTYGCKGENDRVGVLLAQLGTPDAPTTKDLRRYLRQFLSDRRVIEVPRIIWWFILNFIILVVRPKRSASLYKRLWTEDGSPLLNITRKQAAAVSKEFKSKGFDIAVEFGMRYGNPSLGLAIDRLISSGCTRILLFPMYPQYAAATTASAYDAVFAHLLKKRFVPTLRVAAPYYRHPSYLNALAQTINQSLKSLFWEPDCLLLSFHGVPEKYVDKGDPYCCHCTETAEKLRELVTISPKKVKQTFQSRFGNDPWLRPYTDETLILLANNGQTKVVIAAPGFTADCLETLDELGVEGRESFMHAGGKEYCLIPCLNDNPRWIEAMSEIILEELQGWQTKAEPESKNRKVICCPRCRLP